jgi:hypothetical protein
MEGDWIYPMAFFRINGFELLNFVGELFFFFLSKDWVHWPVPRQLNKSTCHISPIFSALE